MNKIIYDSVHGHIELPKICIDIINTVEFQRLRDIYQLGTCYYVFPGASHKRFEHSIGVCYLSGELMYNLKDKHPELNIDKKKIELVQIAGLCHDLGHGPFSHLFDNEFIKKYQDINNPNIHHENRSCIMLKRIVSKYKININDSDLEIINDLINPSKFILKEKWIYQIVSNCYNGIDVDKFDYIARDTKNIGLSYGFDFQRLLKLAKVIDNHICYPIKTIFEINNLFQTRHRLHKEIYSHPVVKSIEYMISDIFTLCENKLKISEKINNPEDFIILNDSILSTIEFMESSDENILKAKEILKNIKLRNLYKYVGEINNSNINVSDFASLKKIILDVNPEYKFPVSINENDVIIEKLNLSYNFNPLDHVLFYENGNNLIKINKTDYMETIRPINEKKIRLFCKKKENLESLQNIIMYLKNIK